MSNMIFEITAIEQAGGQPSKAIGSLKLNEESFSAVSGGHKKGALPFGRYKVRTHHVVTNPVKVGFRIGDTGFFIPIEIEGKSDRTNLGIHPDGNLPGTEGCIGLQGADAAKFWKSWNSLPLESRPQALTITSKIEA